MILAKNSTKKYTSKRLFHTFCLRHRVAAAVPKANNVDNIAIDTIDQPTQIVDEYAAINLVAVFKKRIFGGNVGELTQIFSSVAYFLHKNNHCFFSKGLTDIFSNLSSAFIRLCSPNNLHTASANSYSSSRASSSSNSRHTSSSGIPRPATISASALSSIAFISSIV